MKYFLILTLTAFASADRLDKTSYLPPHSRSSSGASAGLQTPLLSSPQGPNPRGQLKNQAEILRFDNEMNEEGYRYAFETSDGTKAEQQGRAIPGAVPEEGSIQVSGSYSYIGDDGQTYTVTYTADENGYRAEGAHLPTPPPIPAEILKSLKLTARSEGQYDRQKSSYDADAGY